MYKLLYWTAGLILSGAVQSWRTQLSSLRLSQLLDMYYSHRGVNFDPQYSACERQARLKELEETSDLLQTEVNRVTGPISAYRASLRTLSWIYLMPIMHAGERGHDAYHSLFSRRRRTSLGCCPTSLQKPSRSQTRKSRNSALKPFRLTTFIYVRGVKTCLNLSILSF